jgi:hypothetical protein
LRKDDHTGRTSHLVRQTGTEESRAIMRAFIRKMRIPVDDFVSADHASYTNFG